MWNALCRKYRLVVVFLVWWFWGDRCTYICIRQRGEAYTMTILDDWLTGTREVDIHVLALVHSKLSAGYHYHAILHSCDVGGTADDTTDEKGVSDILDGEAGERGVVLWGQGGYVDYAAFEGGEGTWFAGVRCRRWEDDVRV